MVVSCSLVRILVWPLWRLANRCGGKLSCFFQDALGDLASEVVFDCVLCITSATKHASVGSVMAFLVSSERAPPVPECAEGGRTDSGWSFKRQGQNRFESLGPFCTSFEIGHYARCAHYK